MDGLVRSTVLCSVVCSCADRFFQRPNHPVLSFRITRQLARITGRQWHLPHDEPQVPHASSRLAHPPSSGRCELLFRSSEIIAILRRPEVDDGLSAPLPTTRNMHLQIIGGSISRQPQAPPRKFVNVFSSSDPINDRSTPVHVDWQLETGGNLQIPALTRFNSIEYGPVIATYGPWFHCRCKWMCCKAHDMGPQY